MQLSPNFTLVEFTMSQTASRRGINNMPPDGALDNLRRLAAILEDVRQLLGRPITITSGYRSPSLNAVVGGSQNSAHQHGLAADFIAPPLTPFEVAQSISKSMIMFDQLIYEYDWVHFAISGPTATMRRQVLTRSKAGSYREGLHES
jgi:hypothetical protein